MWSCARGKQAAAATLFHWNNGPLKVCNKDGFTPLTIARQRGHHSVAEQLEMLQQHTSSTDMAVFISTEPFTSFTSTQTFSSPDIVGSFSGTSSKPANIPITSTPSQSTTTEFVCPQSLPAKSSSHCSVLHIDIPPPPPYPGDSKLIRRRSEQAIKNPSQKHLLNKRFSVDVLPTSAADSAQSSPGGTHQRPIREACSEPYLPSETLMQTDASLITEKGLGAMLTDVQQEASPLLIHMDTGRPILMARDVCHKYLNMHTLST